MKKNKDAIRQARISIEKRMIKNGKKTGISEAVIIIFDAREKLLK
ncbi:MAG TPA: hypothetical protein P5239_08450 [Victivallales bacterium]|nr:hypothetical protein [Victivallales bacterium]